MSTYPAAPRSAFLAWAEAHAPVFAAHAAEIGLTPEQAQAVADAAEAAREAFVAQEAARAAAQAATAAAVQRLDELRGAVADAVRLVRAFAEASDDPGVYQRAQIPAPAARSPAPPPAQPTGLRVELDPTLGALTLFWKASNPRGTSGTAYLVRRRLPGETGFAFLGATGGGTKHFVDATLPAGVESVQYTVQGQRAGTVGPVSAIFTVSVGRPTAHRSVAGRLASGEAPARLAA